MRVYGNVQGLRPRHLRLLSRLYRRREPRHEFCSQGLAMALQEISAATGRRVGVLVDRGGRVRAVAAGNACSVAVPDIGPARVSQGRLSGLRWIYVAGDGTRISQEELWVLRMRSLDAIVLVLGGGSTPRVQVAHLLPDTGAGKMWEVRDPYPVSESPLRFDSFIVELEREIVRSAHSRLHTGARDIAVVVLPVVGHGDEDWELDELVALCKTAGIAVVDVAVQRRESLDPRTLIGTGKLREITMQALQRGCDLIVFGRPLTPSQQRNLARETRLRVIDRNQLILDIFAKHARTEEGKLQVELAQLRYNLPRLSEKDDSMSRLTGGIGALGPGETKLEMERRRARERMHKLMQRVEAVRRNRSLMRKLRRRRGVKVAALIGYTNAGKSTIFNALTDARTPVDDKLFATLDPMTRPVRYPRPVDLLVTDTVGFIRDLPPELVGAFKATLEEVEVADILLHVADITHPHLLEQVSSVRRILQEMGLHQKTEILLLNKIDRAGPGHLHRAQTAGLNGLFVSGLRPQSLEPVLTKLSLLLEGLSAETRV